jgi:twinfilin-like protein
MVYASGARSTHITMKNILTTLPRSLNSNIRRIETSDPNELNEDFLKVELGLDVQGTERLAAVEPKAFAKPKGPPRRR